MVGWFGSVLLVMDSLVLLLGRGTLVHVFQRTSSHLLRAIFLSFFDAILSVTPNYMATLFVSREVRLSPMLFVYRSHSENLGSIQFIRTRHKRAYSDD